jgi:hypothetical protein
MNIKEARESERLLRQVAEEMNVQPKHVPNAIKTMLDESNQLDAKLKVLGGK